MHVFLSYARSSEEQATAVEKALRSAGYIVWRDTDLPAHLSYAEVIEERLKSAKAVLVLWSAEAAKSQWVRAEADAARELGTLVQSSVDGTIPPIPFNQIQCANLAGWNGENDHPGWRKLKASVIALAGQVEQPAETRKRQRPTSSICVLPFQNLSGEDVPDYFCDGITEDITSDLSKISALSVVPRKTAFQFKGQDVDPCAVAEKLNVSHVLEGSVRRAGDRVRVAAQLTDGCTGDPEWSDRYYREFSDVFSVQDEITKAIVDALQIKLLPAEKKAIEERETTSEPPPAKAQILAHEVAQSPAAPAFGFDAQNDGASAPEIEVRDAPAPIAPAPIAPVPSAPAPMAPAPIAPVPVAPVTLDQTQAEITPDASEAWNSGENWNSGESWTPGATWTSRAYGDDDEEEEETPKRDYLNAGMAPRLVALGIALLVIVALVGLTFWPNQSAAVADQGQEEKLTYTVTTPVNVRSLPLKTSRVLGELKEGDTINIVPTLAGAQPDWLKIKDGPYIGGYVWRESTRPASASGESVETDSDTKPRKKATG